MITPSAFIDPLESMNTYLASVDYFAPSLVVVAPPAVELLTTQRYPDDTLRLLERAMRTVDKSELMMGPSSHTEVCARSLAPKTPVERDCEIALDHVNLSFRIQAGQQVIQEFLRQSPASHTQALPALVSLTAHPARAILPWHLMMAQDTAMARFWKEAMETSLTRYMEAVERFQWDPGQAHGLLPSDFMGELVTTMSIRGWRSFLASRTAPGISADMQIVAREMLRLVMLRLPLLFQDIHQAVQANIGEKDMWLEQGEAEVAARHQVTYSQWRNPLPITPRPCETNPKLDPSKDFWVPYADARKRPDMMEDWSFQHLCRLVEQ
nr:FAD-dependent thymidylate synthase [uncultured Holophaga sp.]